MFLQQSIGTAFGRILMFGFALANSVIISRWLGPLQRGTFSIVILIISLSQLLLLFGLGAANVYLGAKDENHLHFLAGNSLAAAFVLGGIGWLIFVAFSFHPFISLYLTENGISPLAMRWIVGVLPFALSITYLQEIFRAKQELLQYNGIILASVICYFVGLMLCNILFEWHVMGSIIARIGSYLFVFVFVLVLLKRSLTTRMRLSWTVFKQSMSYGSKLYVGNLAQFLNYRLDLLLVGYFLNPIEVGIYATSTSLAEKLWEIPSTLRIVLMPKIASSQSQLAATNLTTTICRLVFFLSGLLCLFVAIAASFIVTLLYGAAYLPAAPALIALMPGVWALSIGKLIAVHLASAGRPIIGTIGAVVALIVTLILDIILIPKIGILGAAIASSTSYIVSTIIFLGVFSRSYDISLTKILVLQKQDLYMMMQVMQDGWVKLRKSTQRLGTKRSSE